jgi:alkylation response protein AidB-like acyl-CoA dehydrogenase|tara:strand:- start:159 stop:374 length:216 start_codon:yes stop_codon:yes gene_type:complete
MNALLKLLNEQRIGKLERRVKLLDSSINDIWKYLKSSKFNDDPMVNSQDILRMIAELKSTIDYIDNDFYGE